MKEELGTVYIGSYIKPSLKKIIRDVAKKEDCNVSELMKNSILFFMKSKHPDLYRTYCSLEES